MEVNLIKFLALIFNLLIGVYSYKRKKLTLDGVIAALIIGIVSIVADIQFFVIVIVFFLTSTYATKLGASIKNKILSTYKVEKTRNIIQVLCNGGIPTIYTLITLILINKNDNTCISKLRIKNCLIRMYTSYYAACNADTWASEIGILSKGDPILITDFTTVPKGTNGGVSLLGTIVSALGGLLIGLTSGLLNLYICDQYLLHHFIKIGLFSGLFGSFLDSLLGALFQETIYLKETKQIISRGEYLSGKKCLYVILGKDYLSNNLVNVVSALITSLIVGIYNFQDYIMSFEDLNF